MITITAAEAAHNFGTLKSLLLATAPSQKAIDFANRVFDQIEARGAEWMAANAVQLQILSPARSLEDDLRTDAPSVGENRPYYMAALQVALRNA